SINAFSCFASPAFSARLPALRLSFRFSICPASAQNTFDISCALRITVPSVSRSHRVPSQCHHDFQDETWRRSSPNRSAKRAARSESFSGYTEARGATGNLFFSDHSLVASVLIESPVG